MTVVVSCAVTFVGWSRLPWASLGLLRLLLCRSAIPVVSPISDLSTLGLIHEIKRMVGTVAVTVSRGTYRVSRAQCSRMTTERRV